MESGISDNVYSAVKHKFLPVAFLLFITFISRGQVQLFQYNTSDLRTIYITKGYSYMVPHMARCYENAMDFHRDFWNYTPTEEVSVLLNDFSDIGNGGTLVIPWNMLTVGIAPFNFTYNIIPSNERFQWLMNHELTHVVMCDKAACNDLLYRKIYGLEHLAVVILKKIKLSHKAYEWEVPMIINLFQIVIIFLGFVIFF